MNEQALSLEHECPQCGAPVVLQETDRIFCCPFCHVRLCIFSPTHISYYLKPLSSLTGQLIFIPYWRMRGTKMALSETACRAEVVDYSALAVPFKEFPATLGIRPQTMTLKFVEPGSLGIFFPPLTEKNDFFQETPVQSLEQEDAVHALIGEIVSIVYAPFFKNGKTVIDGITGRSAFEAQNSEALFAQQEKAPFKLTFVPTVCPNCNWNLQGEKETLVLVCSHCGTAWQASEQGMQPVEARILSGGSDTAIWVPFWVLDVDYGTIKLTTFADFIRLTNIPIPIKPESEKKSFSMWIPAFKANPELFFRLGKQMSILQGEIQKSDTLPENFYPVTLPASEAFQSLPVMLGEIAVAKKKAFPFIIKAAFSLRSATLAFVPFVPCGAELVQPQSTIAINKNALAWARGI